MYGKLKLKKSHQISMSSKIKIEIRDKSGGHQKWTPLADGIETAFSLPLTTKIIVNNLCEDILYLIYYIHV